jgi:hypothetical protein
MISDSSATPNMPGDPDWTPIKKESPTAIEVFIALKSITRISKDVVRAWVKYRYPTPRSFDSKYIKELGVYNEYNCSERRCKILQSKAYFTDGTHGTDLSERQSYVVSEDAAYKYLCK